MPSVKAPFALLCFLLFLASCAKDGRRADYSSCIECHKGIEEMGGGHKFECARCHLHPKDRGRNLSEHSFVVRNPSDPKTVAIFCLPCHEREIDSLEASLHSTMAGIINQTRYLWGAQESAFPYTYGLSGPFQRLPQGLIGAGVSPSALVDDFLRRRCLRCHIHTRGTGGRGLYRSTGCAACHVIYDDDGLYKGGDKAIPRDRAGFPALHGFTDKIPVSQCLRCHNGNRVGADYVGLFERDHHSNYRLEGEELIYGLDYHNLSRDVHFERGLWCTDCHGAKDVMAGKERKTCEDCHGSWEGKKEESRGEIVSRSGKTHRIQAFSIEKHSQGINGHRSVRCSACHAQWSFQDYGMSLIREDLLDAYKWRHLAAQGDPSHTKTLRDNRDNPLMIRPLSEDWVSGEKSPGLWSYGWRFRRWEPMPLGRDRENRYSVLRPLYQYLVSFVDAEGRILLDSVIPQRGDSSGIGWAFMPYSPHTVAPYGRQCDSCHMNRTTAGLGIYEGDAFDSSLTIPSHPVPQGGRLLDDEEKKRLMEPSQRFHKERANALSGRKEIWTLRNEKR